MTTKPATEERRIAEQITSEHFEKGWTRTELADAIEKALLAQREREHQQ